jgi:hypothetical protein
MQTYQHTNIPAYQYTHTYKHTNIETYTQETYKHTYKKTKPNNNKQKQAKTNNNKQTQTKTNNKNNQSNKQANKQTRKQSNKQTNKQPQINRHTYIPECISYMNYLAVVKNREKLPVSFRPVLAIFIPELTETQCEW